MAGHYATWQSAVEGFSDVKSLIGVRKELKKLRPPTPVVGERLKPKGSKFTYFAYLISYPYRLYDSYWVIVCAVLFKEKRTKLWCAPFPGSDASVVRSSQQSVFMTNGGVAEATSKPELSYPQYGMTHPFARSNQ
jgi:hypothetical protein